jgi:hypothetical protein
MSIGFFTDKHHEPTDEEIRQTIGSGFSLWDELIQSIRETYAPAEDFKFLYGASYGWGHRFRLKGKLLTTLYPTSGGITAQIILNPQAVDAALAMPIGTNTRQAIEKANPYPEGRWLFIPVESAEDLDDVRHLLKLRVNTKPLKK